MSWFRKGKHRLETMKIGYGEYLPPWSEQRVIRSGRLIRQRVPYEWEVVL